VLSSSSPPIEFTSLCGYSIGDCGSGVADNVKLRRYDSPVRDRRAQQTRTAIMDAAERLFTTRGFVRTTLPAVADAASVSLATVKLLARTKTDLVLTVWHRTLAGVDDQVPVVQRDWFRRQYEIADPVERIEFASAMGLMVRQRIAGLMAVIESGATVDDSLAELKHRMFEEHWHATRRFRPAPRRRRSPAPGTHRREGDRRTLAAEPDQRLPPAGRNPRLDPGPVHRLADPIDDPRHAPTRAPPLTGEPPSGPRCPDPSAESPSTPSSSAPAAASEALDTAGATITDVTASPRWVADVQAITIAALRCRRGGTSRWAPIVMAWTSTRRAPVCSSHASTTRGDDP